MPELRHQVRVQELESHTARLIRENDALTEYSTFDIGLGHCSRLAHAFLVVTILLYAPPPTHTTRNVVMVTNVAFIYLGATDVWYPMFLML